MKLKTLNFKGSETKSVEISDKILKLKMNHKLVKNVVDWQLNHLKTRTAKTKQRNEIKGSTRKIVPQKEVVEQDTQVEKLQFLLVAVLLTVQKEIIIKLKKSIKR